MKKWILVAGVVALIAVAVLFGRGYLAATVAQSQAAPTATPSVPVATMGDQIIAEGVVVPVRQVSLSVATAGLVTGVMASEGEHVEAGQLMVQLDGQALAGGPVRGPG